MVFAGFRDVVEGRLSLMYVECPRNRYLISQDRNLKMGAISIVLGVFGALAVPLAALRAEEVVLGAPKSADGAPVQANDNAATTPSVVYDQPSLPSAANAMPPAMGWTERPGVAPEALADAIAIVTEKDPSALAAWSQARAANAGIRSARWQRFPSVDLNANISSGARTILPTATVDLPLWSGGRLSASLKRAKRLEDAAVAAWQDAVLQLSLQITDFYYQAVLNTQLAELYRLSLVEHNRLVQTMERRVAQEVSPAADLALARSREAQIKQDMMIITAQRDTALQNLAELIRDPSFRLGDVPDYQDGALLGRWLGVEEEVNAYNPTRRRLAFEAEAAQEEIALNRSLLFPQVSAQYTYNEISGSRIGIGVRMQTSNGLSRFSDIDSARSRYDASISELRLFERQLDQNIANEIIAHNAAMMRSDVSLFAAESAGLVSASYMRQFIAGRRSWLDVMNSLREHLVAQSGLVQAQVTAMATDVRLNLQSGRWRPTIAAKEGEQK